METILNQKNWGVNAAQMRLLICFCCTHPDKMDATKQVQWQKLAKQSTADMEALLNLDLLGVPINKKPTVSGLWFGTARKRTFRKVRLETWPHCSFRGSGD